jgi:hypothetical protein
MRSEDVTMNFLFVNYIWQRWNPIPLETPSFRTISAQLEFASRCRFARRNSLPALGDLAERHIYLSIRCTSL